MKANNRQEKCLYKSSLVSLLIVSRFALKESELYKWFHAHEQSTVLSTTVSLTTTDEPCRETSNFGFNKTHKTGSTTLRSITSRFRYFRNFSFLLGTDTIIGNIYSIRLDWNNLKILPHISINQGDYANYRNYNISDVYILFEPDKMERLMNPAPNVKYILIVREPTEQWRSNFQYYKRYQATGLILTTLNKTLLPFLKSDEAHKLDFNRQSKDLGISPDILPNLLESTFDNLK
ncbi:putative galactose-3-O-sulfotransferase 4-like [Apostichopus japonicus]|uniref:Putative galactose-3-O-sulfotransferase 4-like n=1 Tax=Stichopus japonicus TaxID=307972 RepID=A0A2G8LAM6_STIJA|nr:putative galactose-3-O-sulfotransferase 4-like [Apostichopus japonicus]